MLCLYTRPSLARAALFVLLLTLGATRPGGAQTSDIVVIRGHRLAVHLYGKRGGLPVIVSSGDGGWVHLGPHVAETLAANGFFVVGFDARAYLESFTSGATTLKAEEEPADFRVLAEYASRTAVMAATTGGSVSPEPRAPGPQPKPLLIGVSEGAGLSLLAATDPRTQSVVAGVIGLGLPDVNELGWRWKDAIIYLTHGVPKEPTFSAAAIASQVAPLPLAAIHSTSDEFVPVSQIEQLMRAAKEPKKLWVIKAANHRFSDNLAEFDRRLLEAVDWVRQNQPR
jgi:alpha-beta hydrolase superfamily lysophospholipase